MVILFVSNRPTTPSIFVPGCFIGALPRALNISGDGICVCGWLRWPIYRELSLNSALDNIHLSRLRVKGQGYVSGCKTNLNNS